MPRRERRAQIGLAGIGLDLAASVGVGTLLGWWIDRRFDTAPWGTIICASIGIIGGLLNFVRAGQRAARESQEEALEDARGVGTASREAPDERGD